jgi:hypothetical protein
MNHHLFYKELGRLLYAIAAADGRVSPAEVRRLHEVVGQVLVPAEPSTDKYGTDQAWTPSSSSMCLPSRAPTPRASSTRSSPT